MKINNAFPFNPIDKLNSQKAKVEKKEAGSLSDAFTIQDKLVISEDAKMLISNTVSNKDLVAVRARIQSGFYNQDKVLSAVADSILNEFK